MEKNRRKSRTIQIGNQNIGGNNPILVQSMTNTDTRDVEATLNQIRELEQVGCEIIRVAVPDMKAAVSLGKIKKKINIPLVADIHFDHRLALEAIKQGVDKLRINPGNITKEEEDIEKVVKKAKGAHIPVRVGVNSGSLKRDILDKYGGVNAKGMVESALREIEIFEKTGFYDVVISLKSPSVKLMIEANRLISCKVDYPLHLGVTEAGVGDAGVIRSSLGIGTLLEEGIGDTIRVSLTGDPEREVQTAWEILGALDLRKRGVRFISCPTCGRIGINLEKIVEETKQRLPHLKESLKVAIMGCVVNGLGEARESDIGLVGGKGRAILYRDGKRVKKVKEEDAARELVKLVLNYNQINNRKIK